MARPGIVGVLLLASACGGSGSSAPPAAPPEPPPAQLDPARFQSTLGGIAHDTGIAVRPDPDGGYVIALLADGAAPGVGDLALVATDPTGTPRWRREIRADVPSADLEATADGRWVLRVEAPSDGSAPDELVFVSGDGASRRSVELEGPGRFEQLARAADGDLLLGGAIERTEPGASDRWLLARLDDGGRERWRREYTIDDVVLLAHGGIAVAEAPDGGLLLVGATTDAEGGRQSTAVLRTNALGEPLERVLLDPPFDDGRFVPVALVEDGERGVWIAGRRIVGQRFIESIPTLLVLDPGGALAWSAELSSWRGDGVETLPDADGGVFVVSGRSRDADADGIGLVAFDRSGGERWRRFVPDGSARDAARTPDGGIVTVGRTERYGAGATDVLLVRTDDEGRSGPPPPDPITGDAPAWSDATVIAEGLPVFDFRAGVGGVSVDPAGNALVVWEEPEGESDTRIRLARRPAGGTWQEPETLFTASGREVHPRVVATRSGEALVGWTAGFPPSKRLQVGDYSFASGFAGPAQLAAASSFGDVRLAGAPGGGGVAAWVESVAVPGLGTASRLRVARRTGGSWSAPALVEPFVGGSLVLPDAGLARDGGLLLAWYRDDAVLRAARAAPGSLELRPVPDLPIDASFARGFATDRRGGGLAAWRVVLPDRRSRYESTLLGPEGGFGPVRELARFPGPELAPALALALDDGGTGIATWAAEGLVEAAVWERGSWSTARVVQADPVPASFETPRAVVVSDGRALLLWSPVRARRNALWAAEHDARDGFGEPELLHVTEPDERFDFGVGTNRDGAVQVVWRTADRLVARELR